MLRHKGNNVTWQSLAHRSEGNMYRSYYSCHCFRLLSPNNCGLSNWIWFVFLNLNAWELWTTIYIRLFRYETNYTKTPDRCISMRSWHLLSKKSKKTYVYEHFDEFHFAEAMFAIEEDEKAVELEFENAVSVMAGEKEFPCVNCDKICKSKAGLTRHVNAKHGEKAHGEKEALSSSIASFTEEELVSIVDKIKAKITKDGFWDSEITTNLEAVKSTKTLFDHILPIYCRFFRKQNQDIFLTDFYELVPTSCQLLQCDNQQLIMQFGHDFHSRPSSSIIQEETATSCYWRKQGFRTKWNRTWPLVIHSRVCAVSERNHQMMNFNYFYTAWCAPVRRTLTLSSTAEQI